MLELENRWQLLGQEMIDCRLCPRMVTWREEVAQKRKRAYRDQVYWGRPITGFGDRAARVFVIGLAPGAHGANRTGRVFTGDGSGKFLFRALHKAGFANQPESSHAGDGLELRDIFIGAICRCAPPANKPLPDEITACLPFLKREYDLLQSKQGIVVLGKIAYDNTLRMLKEMGLDIPRLEFAHGAFYPLGKGLPWLLASYHPSLQNTQTGRLTEAMFDEIWQTAQARLRD